MKNKIVKLLFVAVLSLFALPALSLANVGTVTNVVAKPGDAEVKLSWTAVMGATKYKIYHGTKPVSDNEAYNLPTIKTVNAASEFTVGDLVNGQTYYFSVTALDASGNESEFYSEPEASATPQAISSGSNAAQLAVVSTRSVDSETVNLKFNDKVAMPSNATQKFRIIYEFNQKPLKILSVNFVSGSEDSLLIKTAPQEPGGEYLLVIPNDLASLSGKTLSSADLTVNFLGSSLVANGDDSSVITQVAAVDAFKVVNVESKADITHVVTFSRPVVLPTKAQGGPAPFTILNNSNPDLKIRVDNYTLDDADPMKVILTTEPLLNAAHTLVVANVTDTSGNLITGQDSILEFGGSSIADLLPPEDVANLRAKIQDLTTLLVALNWIKSANTANDLVEYILYQSVDGQNFTRINSYNDATLQTATVSNLTPNTTYTFKLTAKDRSGNESSGVTTTITLPETGPGLVGLAMGSLLAGRYLARRKRND